MRRDIIFPAGDEQYIQASLVLMKVPGYSAPIFLCVCENQGKAESLASMVEIWVQAAAAMPGECLRSSSSGTITL